MKKAIGLFVLVGMATAVAPILTAPARAQEAAPRRIVVTAQRFAYTPGTITLREGQPVVLILKSADVAHGLRIRQLSINLKVKAGGTAVLHFTPDKPGTFTARCSVFCGAHHGSMKMQVRVVK